MDVPEGVVPVATEGAGGGAEPDAVWLGEAAVLQPEGSVFFLCVRGLAAAEEGLAADFLGGFAVGDGAVDGADEFCAGGAAVP